MILPFPYAEPDQAETMRDIEYALARPFTPPNWSAHWDATLRKFEDSGYDLNALQPAFVNRSTILRWQGKYIEAPPNAEQLFIDMLRRQLFEKYLSDISHLYEFGAGSCCNVAAFAQQYPDIPVTGCDFSPAAVRIADLLSEHHGMKVEGRLFNFDTGDYTLDYTDAGVLTWCALEQVGIQWTAFFECLMAKKPKRVVHVEPLIELYQPTPFDRLAWNYHRMRNYLYSYLPALKGQEMQGNLRILHCERTGFGSRFHEGYSVIVWEPA